MKIALIGYGNMGKEIDTMVSESKKYAITSISLRTYTDTLDKKGIAKADVVIDFTGPKTVLKNIREILPLNKHLVVGTTGWYEHINEVKKLVKKHKAGFVYGHNFSIGANIFFSVVAHTAMLAQKFDYDVFGYELHHSGKKDSPSGTAKKIAEVIMQNFPSKKQLQENKLDRQIKADELHFASIRGGRNFGYHEVTFDSKADQIKLIHEAHGRSGFAQGALLAAEFIAKKTGFFRFDEIFAIKG